jgi:N-acetylneuraminate synthase/N,N'-diacetyllegionaminate synthase
MARTGLPTVISTGMATAADIDDAVSAFRSAGGKELILLLCTSSYPTPPSDVHLRKLLTLAQTFGCLVGFSDHTDGVTAAIGSVALGACFIEKHFTLDKNLPGPDHKFSSDLSEWRQLAHGVRTIEAALGSTTLAPSVSEITARREYRLSCAASRALPVGHRLEDNDIVFLRPGYGVPPKERAWLIHATLKRPMARGQIFVCDDIV